MKNVIDKLVNKKEKAYMEYKRASNRYDNTYSHNAMYDKKKCYGVYIGICEALGVINKYIEDKDGDTK